MKAEAEKYLKKVKIPDNPHPVYSDGRIIGTLELSEFFRIFAEEQIIKYKQEEKQNTPPLWEQY